MNARLLYVLMAFFVFHATNGSSASAGIAGPDCEGLNSYWRSMGQEYELYYVDMKLPPGKRGDAAYKSRSAWSTSTFSCPSKRYYLASAFWWASQFRRLDPELDDYLNRLMSDVKAIIVRSDRPEDVLPVAVAYWNRGDRLGSIINIVPRFFDYVERLPAAALPFVLPAVIIHEFAHRYALAHVRCTRGNRKGLRGGCDNDFDEENLLGEGSRERAAYSITLGFAKWFIKNKEKHGLSVDYARKYACNTAKNCFNNADGRKVQRVCNWDAESLRNQTVFRKKEPVSREHCKSIASEIRCIMGCC
jgi:hypothetical protein